MKVLAENLGNAGKMNRELTLVSACSGSLAESTVLQVLGISHKILSASDNDTGALDFIRANFEVEHLHDSMESQTSGQTCLLCRSKGKCCVIPKRADLFVAGLPCKPYSLQRAKRFASGSVKGHSAYDLAFGEFAEWLNVHNPKSGVFENVMGMDMGEDSADESTPLRRLMDLLKKFPWTATPGWDFLLFHMDLADWIRVKRPRIYMLCFNKLDFTADDLRAIEKVMEDLKAASKSSTGSVDDILFERSGRQWGSLFKTYQESQSQKPMVERGTKWRQRSAAIRESLLISPTYSPWTRRNEFQGLGIPHTQRVLDLLNVVTAERLYSLEIPFSARDSQIEEAMAESFVDVSQSHDRRPCSHQHGCLPTVTTSTLLYSFSKDSVVLPQELFMLHGFPRHMAIPPGMTQSNFRSMVGNGMCAPSLAQSLGALFVSFALKSRNREASTTVIDVLDSESDSN